jgi:hypothetical protein
MKTVIVLLALFWPMVATAQFEVSTTKLNFFDRQAIVINNAPSMIELSQFGFENEYSRSSFRLRRDLRWENTSDRPVVAFEVVILRYDPFNRPIRSGGRWLVTGLNSGDWSALAPGQSSGDSTIGFDAEPVMTSVVYVRAIRFGDGSVWFADTAAVEKEIRQRLPVLKDLGDISPALGDEKKK